MAGSHVPRVAETEADPRLRYTYYSTRRESCEQLPSCMSDRRSSPGTEYWAKIAFQKELNTIPSKYMLRRAQTNQQKLLNLEKLRSTRSP